MPVSSVQVSVSTTAVALVAAPFTNLDGTIQDPTPVILENTHATATVYIGGPGVTSSNGYPLTAGSSLPMQLINSDIPYGVTASGTVVVAVLALRQ